MILLCQYFVLLHGHHSDAVFALTVNAQTERLHIFVPPQDIMHRIPQCAGALAVDDGDGLQMAHDGSGEEGLHHALRLQRLHAPDVQLSVEELKDLAEAGAPAMPIGKAAAAYAAEQYAGTAALDSVTAEVDSELDESPAHYEVELHTAWGEFEYLVDAYTGKVLSGQKDLLTTASTPSTPNVTTKPSDQKPDPSGTAQDIGYAKAKSIALNHAGVSENEAYDMDIELDDEDGTLVYEVEFKSGGMEYSYEINAATGAILNHETELDD